MPTDSTPLRSLVIPSALQSDEDKAALRQHLYEIVEGRAFRGSERSIHFLEFILDKAIAGDFESLKERLIGIELFGRSPSYSTSKDAIVRVTASDVRKRLVQHYGWYGKSSRFQINLPPRTYVPEITAVSEDTVRIDNKAELLPALRPASPEPLKVAVPAGRIEKPVELAPAGSQSIPPRPHIRRFLAYYGALATVLLVLGWMFSAHSFRTKTASAHPVSLTAPPWPLLLRSPRPLQVVTSDRGLVDVEALLHKSVSVSEYANHVYIPDTAHLSPAMKHMSQEILTSNRASAVDIPIVVAITELAQAGAQKVAVQMAREFQARDLNQDGNFVFLGSPRSDPWVSLFADQMDFQFKNDKNANEFIEDIHPHPGDGGLAAQLRSSDARTYSVIAFLPNPNAHGSVLILSGLDIVGTQAAGRLITDLPRMTAILHTCGVGENGASPYFELLLHPQIVAGSSTNIQVAACHHVPPRPDSPR
jgi:hypothetical protein